MRNLFVIALAIVSFPACAQETASKPQGSGIMAPCFDVVSTAGDATSPGPIEVNRCTGGTWFLAKEMVSDVNGNPTKKYVFRWRPLFSSNGNEFVFGTPAVPGTPPVRISSLDGNRQP
jgi:hypothetical protein